MTAPAAITTDYVLATQTSFAGGQYIMAGLDWQGEKRKTR